MYSNSADAPPNYQALIIAYPNDRHPFLTAAGQLSRSFSMNARWLFLGGSGAYGKRGQDYRFSVSRPFTRFHFLHSVDTAPIAADILREMPAVAAYNLLLADTDGSASVAEVTPEQVVVRTPGEHGEKDHICASNNFFSVEQ